jgi:predicted secreted protein
MKQSMQVKNAIAALLLALSFQTQASEPSDVSPAPAGILKLSAQAQTEVLQDTVHITLFAEEEAQAPERVANRLHEKTIQATRTVEKSKAQALVSVNTGQVSVYPVTDAKTHRITAWRGRTELHLTSQGLQAASRLARDLSAWMHIGSITFSLSDQVRQEKEATLLQQAITAFKEKAQTSSRAFGYSDYLIREVQIDQLWRAPVLYRTMALAVSKQAKGSVPLAPGKTPVSVSISGSVQMVCKPPLKISHHTE